MTACPYYALSYEYDDPVTPRVMRCTMCYPRIKKGLLPGCAEACPTGAITFGKREELLEVARDRMRKQPQRYLHHIFGEHEFGGTSWLVLAGVSFKSLELHEGATFTSLPDIGTSFLSVVPLVVTIYPGLLIGMHAFSKRRERIAEAPDAQPAPPRVPDAGSETGQEAAVQGQAVADTGHGVFAHPEVDHAASAIGGRVGRAGQGGAVGAG